MKLLLGMAMLLFGFVVLTSSIRSRGSYIRQLSTSIDAKNYNRGIGKPKEYLHFYALNQSSEYLVENVATDEFAMYKSEKELPAVTLGSRVWQKIGPKVDIKIEACGFGDPGYEWAAPIIINGVDSGLKSRGFHVVILSATDGSILKRQVFDTYIQNSASYQMVQFIDSSVDGSIIVIAVRDDGAQALTQSAKDYITNLGSRYVNKLDFRGALALVTSIRSTKHRWFAEAATKSKEGPSSVDIRIWL